MGGRCGPNGICGGHGPGGKKPGLGGTGASTECGGAP